jgi:polyferredoxin
MIAGLAMMFASRTTGTITVEHDRIPLAVTLSDGSVRNGYTIKLLNKSATPHAFDLRIEGAEATLTVIGADAGQPVTVSADGSEAVRVTVTMAHPTDAAIRFVASDVAGKDVLSAVDRFVSR